MTLKFAMCVVSSRRGEHLAGLLPLKSTVHCKSEIISDLLTLSHFKGMEACVITLSVNTELWPHADPGSSKFRHTCHLTDFTPKD